LGIDVPVSETGKTFEENAKIKARAYARISNLTTIADDSGLEVDALKGAPGIYSARYAGEKASDSQRNEYLLAKLADVPWEERKARFQCVIAVALTNGQIKIFTETCAGIIAFQPCGKNGFGYDPVFYLPELGKTMAELTFEEKNAISHRGQAGMKLQQFLQELSTE
jgi:XTP/dITP diphosphohydrolase